MLLIEQYAGGYDDYINQKHENLIGKSKKHSESELKSKSKKHLKSFHIIRSNY